MGLAARKLQKKDYPSLLERLDEIPTLPAVAMQVNELINDPSTTGADIADVLRKDQALTAKVLRLVNSSYYAIPGGVTDVQRALAFLGFNTIAQLVLSVSVVSVFSHLEDNTFQMQDFWKHALATAISSELIAKKIKYAKPEEAFTCGLLHDVGKLVMFQIDRDRLLEVARVAQQRQTSFFAVETEGNEAGHSYLGEAMATKWGLPQTIRLAIRYHHFDVSEMSSILASAKPLINMVRLANALMVKHKIGHSGDCSDGGLTPELYEPLKLTEKDLEELMPQIRAQLEKAGAFLVNG